MVSSIDSARKGAQARAIFEQGYNCAQSVAMAYAEDLGCDEALLSTVASSFGGGFARCREVCGAVSGMGVISGFVIPATDPKDRASKAANYALVQSAIERFRQENGSIVCRELLGLTANPNVRSPKRSCAELVEMAAQLIGEAINSREQK
ncbi:MAG: C-GCAxxG-C-C family protein [Rikenellaceae bacterium]